MSKESTVEATEAETNEAAAVEAAKTPQDKVTVLHEKHAKYIKDQTGIDVDPLAVFLVYSTRVAFRKTSDEYAEVKKAKEQAELDKAAAKEKAKAEREAAAKAKAEKKAADDKAKAEEKAKKEAEKKAADEAKAAEKAKADAEKAAAATTEGEATTEATTATKATSKGRGKRGKTTSADAIKTAEAEAAAAKSPF